MNIENFKEIMNRKGNYNSVKDSIFQGLVIMRKYILDADIDAALEYIVYSSCGIESLVKRGITEEDTEILRGLRWHIDGNALEHHT